MKRSMLAALAATMFSGAAVRAQPAATPGRVIIASDSTAAIYQPDQFPQMGWGMFLGCSLDPAVTVIDLAKGGRSTKTFQ